MNRFIVIVALVLFSAIAGAMAASMFFAYAARAAAFEVVECIKDPEGCSLDPSDVPDFDPADRMMPAKFSHHTEVPL